MTDSVLLRTAFPGFLPDAALADAGAIRLAAFVRSGGSESSDALGDLPAALERGYLRATNGAVFVSRDGPDRPVSTPLFVNIAFRYPGLPELRLECTCATEDRIPLLYSIGSASVPVSEVFRARVGDGELVLDLDGDGGILVGFEGGAERRRSQELERTLNKMYI